MHQVLLVIALVLTVVAPSPAQSRMTDRIVGSRPQFSVPLPLHPRGVPWTVGFLAIDTKTPAGIEVAKEPFVPVRTDETRLELTGLPLVEALNRLLAHDPRYEWRAMNGVIVVRPKPSWDNPNHPLHRNAGSFSLTNATLPDVVPALLHFFIRDRILTRAAGEDSGSPFSVHVTGTVLDAFNAVARARTLIWEIGEEPIPNRSQPGFNLKLTPTDSPQSFGMTWMKEWHRW
jgi:hypothetical protein